MPGAAEKLTRRSIRTHSFPPPISHVSTLLLPSLSWAISHIHIHTLAAAQTSSQATVAAHEVTLCKVDNLWDGNVAMLHLDCLEQHIGGGKLWGLVIGLTNSSAVPRVLICGLSAQYGDHTVMSCLFSAAFRLV